MPRLLIEPRPYPLFRVPNSRTQHCSSSSQTRNCCSSLRELHHTQLHHCAIVHHSHHYAPTKVVTTPCHFGASLWLYVNGAGRWVRSSEFVFVAEKNEVLRNSGVVVAMVWCGCPDEGSKVLLWRNSGSFQRLTHALGFMLVVNDLRSSVRGAEVVQARSQSLMRWRWRQCSDLSRLGFWTVVRFATRQWWWGSLWWVSKNLETLWSRFPR